MKKIKNIIPGLIVSMLIAGIAVWIETILPVHIIGASIIAIFLGMSVNYFLSQKSRLESGIQFTSKKVLKTAIVLLGATLNIGVILEVGGQTLIILLFTLLTAFGGSYLLGKWMGTNWKLSSMIGAGTGICGGSAIASLAPVIEAEDNNVSYAISVTFLFDMLMIVLFPLIGRMLDLSDSIFGFWAGTAINDTSSVVAASFSFSEAAGEIATMVKLTRTLAIIPTVLLFGLFVAKRQYQKSDDDKGKVLSSISFTVLVPWFIVFFIIMALGNTLGVFTPDLITLFRSSSGFLMVTALAAIGLRTNIQVIRKTGVGPLLHGIILSSLVVIVSLVVTFMAIG